MLSTRTGAMTGMRRVGVLAGAFAFADGGGGSNSVDFTCIGPCTNGRCAGGGFTGPACALAAAGTPTHNRSASANDRAVIMSPRMQDFICSP